MTERLIDERLRYLSENPEDVECEDVRPMADELLSMRQEVTKLRAAPEGLRDGVISIIDACVDDAYREDYESVPQIADRILALLPGPVDVASWNVAQGQIAELQHRLSAGPVMPETPSDDVIREIMEKVVYDAVRRSVCLRPLYDSIDLGVCLMRQALYEVPGYTTSIDAAVSLLKGRRWTANSDGLATVAADDGEVFVGEVAGNPAAALVAAWLSATA